uniref:ATP-dependent RNA helicase DHX34 n=1 Tax=Varanus komodoensis TaxID=61221 RepID=A0A8D2L3Q1_VARKO
MWRGTLARAPLLLSPCFWRGPAGQAEHSGGRPGWGPAVLRTGQERSRLGCLALAWQWGGQGRGALLSSPWLLWESSPASLGRGSCGWDSTPSVATAGQASPGTWLAVPALSGLQWEGGPRNHLCSAEAEQMTSSRHQILAFVSLLETNRPYLVNCLRLPALQVRGFLGLIRLPGSQEAWCPRLALLSRPPQALLLLAQSLDTNADCTCVVADSWLELQIPSVEAAVRAVSTALRLRGSWEKVLDQQLESRAGPGPGPGPGPETGAEKEPPSAQEVHRLTQELLQFLSTEVPHSLRRLTPLERESLYVGPQTVAAGAAGLPPLLRGVEMVPNEVKGGYSIGSFLTFNCLAGEGDLYRDCLRSFWTCPQCGLYMPFTPLERMAHEDACQSLGPQGEHSPEGESGARRPFP